MSSEGRKMILEQIPADPPLSVTSTAKALCSHMACVRNSEEFPLWGPHHTAQGPQGDRAGENVSAETPVGVGAAQAGWRWPRTPAIVWVTW